MSIQGKFAILILTVTIFFVPFTTIKVSANEDMNEGLIAYFPFEGNAQDVSGNSNHGTEIGAVTYTDGAVGLSAAFDGTSYIMANGTPFTLDEWTISFWVYIEETPPQYWYSIVSKEARQYEGIAGNYNYAFTYYYNQWFDSQYESCDGNNEDHMMHPGRPLSTGQWYHIVSTRDAFGNYKIYLNGKYANQGDGIDTPCTSDPDAPFLIGGKVTDLTYLFKGKIDELRVYGVAHSAEFANSIYNAPEYQSNQSELVATIDIKPGSCTNPLNIKSKGVLSVTILGTENLDVTEIDQASIRLENVAPIRSNIEDVTGEDCSVPGSDGYLDMTLKFKTEDIVTALTQVVDGDNLSVELTGNLYDGTIIQGEDSVLILDRGNQNQNGKR